MKDVRVGQVVRCIKDSRGLVKLSITKGREYKVVEVLRQAEDHAGASSIKITNDQGKVTDYSIDRFVQVMCLDTLFTFIQDLIKEKAS